LRLWVAPGWALIVFNLSIFNLYSAIRPVVMT